MTKRHLILGVGGQDGSYLAELLLERGTEVWGLHRRSSADNLWRLRLSDAINLVKLVCGDVCDLPSLENAVRECQPHVVWNMADQDNVDASFACPRQAVDVTYGGVANVLEVVKRRPIRLFQPISATVFGRAPPPQNEVTTLDPQSPYACAKAAAWLLCKYYRECHATGVTCGVFFNHDSPRRADAVRSWATRPSTSPESKRSSNTPQPLKKWRYHA